MIVLEASFVLWNIVEHCVVILYSVSQSTYSLFLTEMRTAGLCLFFVCLLTLQPLKFNLTHVYVFFHPKIKSRLHIIYLMEWETERGRESLHSPTTNMVSSRYLMIICYLFFLFANYLSNSNSVFFFIFVIAVIFSVPVCAQLTTRLLFPPARDGNKTKAFTLIVFSVIGYFVWHQ